MMPPLRKEITKYKHHLSLYPIFHIPNQMNNPIHKTQYHIIKDFHFLLLAVHFRTHRFQTGISGNERTTPSVLAMVTIFARASCWS
jgi:hypothetical protein